MIKTLMILLHACDDMVILVFNRSYLDFYDFIDLLDVHTGLVAEEELLSATS